MSEPLQPSACSEVSLAQAMKPFWPQLQLLRWMARLQLAASGGLDFHLVANGEV